MRTAGGRGSIQGGGTIGTVGQWTRFAARDTFGHPASGARRIGNSVSLDFAKEPKRLMSKETSGQDEIVD